MLFSGCSATIDERCRNQIGGQLTAGFILTGFYEDYEPEGDQRPLRDYLPTYIATRAVKP